MANEFKHKDPGSALTQAEFIASDGTGHIFDCQATGDIMYASSATVLKNLGKGAANTVLSMGGSCIPAWTASPSVTDLTIGGGCITLSAATDIDLLDNNASALSFDSTGKTGIIDIVTTDCSEGVTMSGTLGVTGVLTSTGGITVGVCGTGHDVKFFGCEAGAYMLYDESEEQLEIRGASADATTSTGKLLLSTSLTNVNANDVIGSINFQAPAEAGGTDAVAIAAGIRAVAQATFTCAVNATDLIFYTGHSEAATEKFRFTSQNEIGIAGANYGTDGQVLTSGGAGNPVAWEDAGGGLAAASVAEMAAASSTTVAATPGRTQNHPGVAKAWININTNVSTIVNNQDYNVTSVNDCGVGKMKITLATDFADAHYVVAGIMTHACGTGGVHGWIHGFDSDASCTRTAGIFVSQGYSMNSGGCAGEVRDAEDHDVVFFGTQ